MSEVYLALRGVHHYYQEGPITVPVLEAADLQVKRGELVALVAPSGAGKSTLLHLSGLLERARGGDIEICGDATARLSDRARTQMRRERIGYVYQFHHLLPEFTALENVAMPQMIAGVSQARANRRAHELLELMGIAERATHRPGELSGGEAQRVAIARASANRPQVMLCDEPTGNLDPATSDRVFAALMELVREQGAAALIATHNYDLARRADRIVTLNEGRIEPTTL